MASSTTLILLCVVGVILLATPVAAFGAGNIASISAIEGHNWRHGDIEDLLMTVACLRGHKWTNMMVKRTYFGNWLRDYSQAVDVGTLKGVQADTIRILVWVLAFMSFGYATEEFEVTAERLGVYRPEEHIDNPKDYADNVDARQYDQRLRGPVSPAELAVDPNTGMKNYIANESGGWATSLGYIKWSFTRSIHFGRLYTSGSNKGREEDLCEALRCLGQGLHCLEDFGAHTNYTELALRELGHHNVFPHVGTQTEVNLHGKQVYPLVTGTFGGVDFLHSVLGEANDHMTQTEVNESEVDQLNAALGTASTSQNRDQDDSPASKAAPLTSVLSTIPGCGGLVQEAISLQVASDQQAAANESAGSYAPYGNTNYETSRANPAFAAPPGSIGGPPGPGIPGVSMNVDPAAAMAKIYPILVFRDKVVRTISSVVSKIPGLEKAIDTITEKVTLFVMGLLAPFIKPIIAAASNGLKQGSGTVVDASAKQQFLVWTDASSSDPTHSMLSKDHFSNVLNQPAGQVAAAILQYVAPRILFAWDNTSVPVEEVLADVGRVFHHPAARDANLEIHRKMFGVVETWAQAAHGRVRIDEVLSSESVKAGKNHVVADLQSALGPLEHQLQAQMGGGTGSHSATAGGPFSMLAGKRELELAGGQAPDGFEQGGYAPQQGGFEAYGQPGYQQQPPQQQQQGAYEYGNQPPQQPPGNYGQGNPGFDGDAYGGYGQQGSGYGGQGQHGYGGQQGGGGYGGY